MKKLRITVELTDKQFEDFERDPILGAEVPPAEAIDYYVTQVFVQRVKGFDPRQVTLTEIRNLIEGEG